MSGQTNLQEQSREERFLREKFSDFYSRAPITVRSLEKREFGFGGWDKKIEFRHISETSEPNLRARLVRDAPLYVSHSVAYYEFPDARPMTKKNWLSSDLIFDLDADGSACGNKCGKFTCQKCLDAVKQDAIKLIEEFLVPDFGFSRDEMSVNFSGSRGYHVHVFSESVAQLDREARREIADYIGGVGLDFGRLFWNEGKKFLGPSPTQGGFGGKFARAFVSKLSDDSFAISIARKLKKPEERAKLISAIERGNYDNVGIANREKKLFDNFEKMRLTMAGRIDSNVTADTSKLIRMQNSLHGGSGMLAKSVKSLDSFEPMRQAPVFGNTPLKIKASEAVPALNICDYSFGPIPAGETRELPVHSAVYLLCKKAAALA
ncbi:MAG: DNA primase catalytic subunit PriS [Candidatus Micrarchaeota archaeon]|nr:DNA primase catalytic subunit PriS [Candidatus Micrarchaeota archaeon]